MTEFWDKPAEKSGKVLAAFLEGLPLGASAKVSTNSHETDYSAE